MSRRGENRPAGAPHKKERGGDQNSSKPAAPAHNTPSLSYISSRQSVGFSLSAGISGSSRVKRGDLEKCAGAVEKDALESTCRSDCEIESACER